MRRDDALVAVATGHLVADLQLALDGDVDLHHLDDARRQLVALREAIDLVAEVLFAERGRSPRARASFCATSSPPSTGISPQYLRGISSSMLVVELAPFWRRTLPLSSTSLPVVVLPDELLA